MVHIGAAACCYSGASCPGEVDPPLARTVVVVHGEQPRGIPLYIRAEAVAREKQMSLEDFNAIWPIEKERKEKQNELFLVALGKSCSFRIPKDMTHQSSMTPAAGIPPRAYPCSSWTSIVAIVGVCSQPDMGV